MVIFPAVTAMMVAPVIIEPLNPSLREANTNSEKLSRLIDCISIA
jgi:hypothetical protein